jgi:hypothetical protein
LWSIYFAKNINIFMANPRVANRIKETTTTTGTGTVDLDGAETGFQSFVSGIGNGNTCFYTIAHQSAAEWEVGEGTVTDASPDTLSRSTVFASSNSNSLVNFSSGTKDAFVVWPAELFDKFLPTDTVANLSAYSAGRILLPNNGIQMYRDNGSSLIPWGPLFPFTAPVDGDFSWVNQGSASVSTTNGGIHLKAAASAVDNWHVREKTAPTPPYTVDIAFLPNYGKYTTGFHYFGAVFRENGTGELETFVTYLNSSLVRLAVYRWNSPTSFNSTAIQNIGYMPGSVVWMRIEDDNTDRNFYISGDGQNWDEVFTTPRTTFLTADRIGFGINDDGAGARTGGTTVVRWKEG